MPLKEASKLGTGFRHGAIPLNGWAASNSEFLMTWREAEACCVCVAWSRRRPVVTHCKIRDRVAGGCNTIRAGIGIKKPAKPLAMRANFW